MSEKRYALIKDVIAVGREKLETNGSRISLADALLILKERGQLQARPVPMQISDQIVSAEKFYEKVYCVTMDALAVIDDQGTYEKGKEILFRDQPDISCIALIPNLSDEIHSHDYFEMNYVYRGFYMQSFTGDKQVRKMIQGDVVILSPGARHSVLVGEDSLIISIMMTRDMFLGRLPFWKDHSNRLSAFLAEALFGQARQNYIAFHVKNTDFYERCIQTLFYETHQNDEYAPLISAACVQQLFGHLQRDAAANLHIYSAGGKSSRLYQRIYEYIQENYRTVSLEGLADQFHYSRVYISRLISSYSGQTFVALVRQIRMEKALVLLEKAGCSVEETAEETGYASPDHFSRAFKKYYGCPPSMKKKKM